MKIKKILFFSVLVVLVLTSINGRYMLYDSFISKAENPFSPGFLSWSDDHNGLLVLEATAQRIDLLKISDGSLKRGQVFPGKPTGMCVQENGSIYITSDQDNGRVHVVDNQLNEFDSFKSGPGARSPVCIKSKGLLSVCHTWLDEVGIYKLPKGELLKTIPLLKQPFNSVLSVDEKFLFVANFTTHQRADMDTVSSAVSVINTETLEVEKHILLANGSNALRGMTLSSDGKYVLVSHNLGRFQVPTTQLEQGWMNTSALSIIRVEDQIYQGTVLLDEIEHGAAGSWGIDCYDGRIVVAHSGTHDLSVIDEKAFFEKLESTENRESLAYDLNFLSGIRKRIGLPGNGPRAVTMNKKGIFLGMYFSDTVNQVLTSGEDYEINSFALNDGYIETQERLGEKYFNDATYCFQGWQSCNGCHPFDARTDGLNWDLLNDGMGNPRNCKSMLLSHLTPPAMITGIRADAETAVRAGFKYIQFARVPEEYSVAVDAYLKGLQPAPNPYLKKGKLDHQAKRGEKIYHKLGCHNCHSKPYFTDMEVYSFSSRNDTLGAQSWDTPTLIEVWRTGPWMHDGRCSRMKDVFEIERHGIGEQVSDNELNELVKYVLSL